MDIKTELNALEAKIREESEYETVSVNIFINSQGPTIEINQRSPESLKSDGISMQNLRREFITNS